MIPRSGWLAVGALAAAAALHGEGGTAIAAAALGGGAAIASAGTLAAAGRPAAALRLAAVAGGILAIALRLALAGGPGVPPALPTGAGPWTGTISTVSTPLEGSQRFTAALDAPPGLVLAVTAPRYPPVVPGDRLRMTGTLQPPPDSEYGAFLARNGVAATLRTRELAILPAWLGPGRVLEAARRAVDAALARALPEPAAGLASGILVGLRERVDRDLAADFTTTGLSHVLAISGWNIAIVGGLTASLLARRPARVRLVATLAVVVGYTLFAGASASVVRAAAMATVALVTRAGGRPGTAAAALGLAVAGIVAVAPASVLDPGFQLSAAATAGLLAWAEPVAGRIRRTAPWLPGWIVEGLGVSLAAQAATLPIVLLEFGRVAPLSPALNLAVVPLVPAAMAAGAVAAAGGVLAAMGAPGLVAVIAGLPATVLLGTLTAIVRAGADLPFAGLTLEPPFDVIAAGLAAGALVAAGLRRRVLNAIRRRSLPPDGCPTAGKGREDGPAGGTGNGRVQSTHGGAAGTSHPGHSGHGGTPGHGGRADRAVRLALGAAALAAGLLAIAAATQPDGRVHVIVLDVGQGDAILVETGHGGRVLVDGGPDPDRLLVALDRRLPPWDRRLDLIVLTHPHEDHVTGLPIVVERYSVGRLLETGARGTGPGDLALTTALAARGVPTGRLLAGDGFSVDGVQFRALWPDASAVPAEPTDDGSTLNDASIVLLGEAYGRRFLLAGDIGGTAEETIVRRGLPRVDVLKVAHHGSDGSSTARLLDAIRPRVAVISVAARNDYGHPSPATLAALADRGTTVYRTDRDGTVDVAIDGTGIIIRTERRALTAGAATAGAASAAQAPEGPATDGAATDGAARPSVAPPGVVRAWPPSPTRLSSRPCPCPVAWTRPPSSSRSGRRPGTSATRGRWPRSPAGSRPGSRPGRTTRRRSTAGWWRPPPCSTTSTSSCPTTTRPGPSATAPDRPTG